MQKEIDGFETENEYLTRQYLEAIGYEVFKNNTLLPDFTCIDRKNNVVFYEAKKDCWRLSKAQQRIFPKLVASNYKLKLITVKPMEPDYEPDSIDNFLGYKFFNIGHCLLRIREDNASNVLA